MPASSADSPPRGYFGKVPGIADFVFHGLPAQVCELWGDHMAGWVASGSNACGSEWPARFASSPVWRFILSEGLVGETIWIGLLAGSVDSVGRAFPFTVMISTGNATARQGPCRAPDPHLDVLEERMLAFIEGSDRDGGLVAAIDELASHLPPGRVEPPADVAAWRPGEDEDAVCTRLIAGGPAGTIVQSVHSLPRSGHTAGPSGSAVWWHRDPREGFSEICVSRGVLSGDDALPLFLGDWKRHGWQRSERTEGGPLP